MLNAHIGLVLIAPLLLTLGNASSPDRISTNAASEAESARRKCRNSVRAKPLNFVDGHLVSADSVKALVADGKAAEFVEVTCMNSSDSTKLAITSQLPGIPVISIWTQRGPVLQMRNALDAIRDAQQAQFAKTGSFHQDIAVLPALPADVKSTFQSTATGWNATVWVDRSISLRCHMVGGDDKTGGVEGFAKTPVPAGKFVCGGEY